jgi:hypothetical protein
MRTTIRIQDDLAEQAKQLALRTGRTLGEVVEDALREVLTRRPVSQRRAPVQLPRFGLGKLLPGVNLDCTADLLDRMDEPDAAG